jgi:hypothetical protein
MLISGAEVYLQETETKLKAARNYRRMWAGITVGSAAITGLAIELAPKVPGHPGEIHGPLGAVIILGGFATLGAFTQILDGSMLVDSRKSSLHSAQHYAEQAAADRLVQPELDLEI